MGQSGFGLKYGERYEKKNNESPIGKTEDEQLGELLLRTSVRQALTFQNTIDVCVCVYENTQVLAVRGFDRGLEFPKHPIHKGVYAHVSFPPEKLSVDKSYHIGWPQKVNHTRNN